jgi:hypothetical protein
MLLHFCHVFCFFTTGSDIVEMLPEYGLDHTGELVIHTVGHIFHRQASESRLL